MRQPFEASAGPLFNSRVHMPMRVSTTSTGSCRGCTLEASGLILPTTIPCPCGRLGVRWPPSTSSTRVCAPLSHYHASCRLAIPMGGPLTPTPTPLLEAQLVQCLLYNPWRIMRWLVSHRNACSTVVQAARCITIRVCSAATDALVSCPNLPSCAPATTISAQTSELHTSPRRRRWKYRCVCLAPPSHFSRNHFAHACALLFFPSV
jgi:hypothetical protein